MKNSHKSIKNILVIKNDKIGDMILSTSIFRELKENFPKAEITVIVSKSNKQLIEKNKNIKKIIVLDYPPNNYSGFLNYLKISHLLKKEKFDLGIDLRGSFFNIFFLLILANVRYKIGFYNRFFSKFLLNYAYKKDRENKHVTFQRIDLINKALDLKSKNYWPDIAIDKDDIKGLNDFIKEYQLKKFICIIPDASLEYKQWPLEKFDETIKHINKNYPDYKIVLIGSDKEKLEWLKKKNAFIIYPSKFLDLRATYLLFKKSSLVVAHDGGPMHLAWTARTNLIALMPEHLNLNYYGPLGRNCKIISKNIREIKTYDVKKSIDYFLRS